jgi:hypothetical protein
MEELSKSKYVEKNEALSEEFKNTLILDTWRQFQKDLYSCGLESIEFHGNNSDELVTFTFNYLKELDGAKLHALLYRVDIPESLIKNSSKEEGYFEKLTFLILNREAMKVFFRNHYRP